MKENLLFAGVFAAGILFGLSENVPMWLTDHSLPSIILFALVFQVGIGLGVKQDMRKLASSLSWQMLLVPFATIFGTLIFTALGVFLIQGSSLSDVLSVGSGFGYYSLSSVLIIDLKTASSGIEVATQLATIALLANVFREMFALFGIPLFTQIGGRYAAISVAGINSMDVCLPMILQATKDKTLAPTAIFHGIALEISTPLLITLFAA